VRQPETADFFAGIFADFFPVHRHGLYADKQEVKKFMSMSRRDFLPIFPRYSDGDRGPRAIPMKITGLAALDGLL
jgi:hypothetical protein